MIGGWWRRMAPDHIVVYRLDIGFFNVFGGWRRMAPDHIVGY